jgi:predicted RNA binding protein YcfA (HicA-like mRNA interferase family)
MSRLPSLTAKDVVRALKKAGFEEERQRGSHLRMRHPETKRLTVVPMHPGDVHRGLLKAIIKEAGLSEDEFRDFL